MLRVAPDPLKDQDPLRARAGVAAAGRRRCCLFGSRHRRPFIDRDADHAVGLALLSMGRISRRKQWAGRATGRRHINRCPMGCRRPGGVFSVRGAGLQWRKTAAA